MNRDINLVIFLSLSSHMYIYIYGMREISLVQSLSLSRSTCKDIVYIIHTLMQRMDGLADFNIEEG